jgi:glycosyltransferase involved in cell wall biosynthesis
MEPAYQFADRRLPWRALLDGPAPDRILFHNIWFRGHNNPRYSELLPRLRRLDPFPLVCSDRRTLRGLQYRALRWTQRPRDAFILPLLARRYRHLLSVDTRQIPHWPGTAVSDVDDPVYTPAEVRSLNDPALAAYVVTAERAARRFEELGVEKPWHVIPQGVDLAALSPDAVAAARARHRRDGEVAVGYMAGFLVGAGDRQEANTLYNIDHLLALWDEIHARVPEARLWLLGEASESIRRRTSGRDDIVLFGRVPRNRVLPLVASLDVALYPRRHDQGISASKVGEYLGAGVPIVSYDLRVTENVAAAGAGILVQSPREFVDAVEHLAHDGPERARLADAAARAGRDLDWSRLARRYEEEILDRYLPPTSATTRSTASAQASTE